MSCSKAPTPTSSNSSWVKPNTRAISSEMTATFIAWPATGSPATPDSTRTHISRSTIILSSSARVSPSVTARAWPGARGSWRWASCQARPASWYCRSHCCWACCWAASGLAAGAAGGARAARASGPAAGGLQLRLSDSALAVPGGAGSASATAADAPAVKAGSAATGACWLFSGL